MALRSNDQQLRVLADFSNFLRSSHDSSAARYQLELYIQQYLAGVEKFGFRERSIELSIDKNVRANVEDMLKRFAAKSMGVSPETVGVNDVKYKLYDALHDVAKEFDRLVTEVRFARADQANSTKLYYEEMQKSGGYKTNYIRNIESEVIKQKQLAETALAKAQQLNAVYLAETQTETLRPYSPSANTGARGKGDPGKRHRWQGGNTEIEERWKPRWQQGTAGSRGATPAPSPAVVQAERTNVTLLSRIWQPLASFFTALEVPFAILNVQMMTDAFDGTPINPLHVSALKALREQYPNEFRGTGRLQQYMERYIAGQCNQGPNNPFLSQQDVRNCNELAGRIGRAFQRWSQGHSQALDIIRKSGNSFLLDGLEQLIYDKHSYQFYKERPQQLATDLAEYAATRGITLSQTSVDRASQALLQAASIETQAAIALRRDIDVLKQQYPELLASLDTPRSDRSAAYAQAALVQNTTLAATTAVNPHITARAVETMTALSA